jgi:hypothetical protein
VYAIFLQPYFETDLKIVDAPHDTPLPKNDFNRMINFFQSPSLVPKKVAHRPKTCTCDAKTENSKNVQCRVGKHGQVSLVMACVSLGVLMGTICLSSDAIAHAHPS